MAATKLKRPETLKYQASEEIRRLLISGELQVDEIYSANYFASLLGISRTPAREALLELCSEGYFVSVLGRGFQVRKLSPKEIQDFFETRKIIEGYIIGRLRERITPSFIRDLKQNVAQMDPLCDKGGEIRFLELDKAFHMAFVTLYDNAQLAAIMDNIRNQMLIIGRKALVRQGRTREVIREHQDIVTALDQNDYDGAADFMKSHIRITETRVLAPKQNDPNKE